MVNERKETYYQSVDISQEDLKKLIDTFKKMENLNNLNLQKFSEILWKKEKDLNELEKNIFDLIIKLKETWKAVKVIEHLSALVENMSENKIRTKIDFSDLITTRSFETKLMNENMSELSYEAFLNILDYISYFSKTKWTEYFFKYQKIYEKLTSPEFIYKANFFQKYDNTRNYNDSINVLKWITDVKTALNITNEVNNIKNENFLLPGFLWYLPLVKDEKKLIEILDLYKNEKKKIELKHIPIIFLDNPNIVYHDSVNFWAWQELTQSINSLSNPVIHDGFTYENNKLLEKIWVTKWIWNFDLSDLEIVFFRILEMWFPTETIKELLDESKITKEYYLENSANDYLKYILFNEKEFSISFEDAKKYSELFHFKDKEDWQTKYEMLDWKEKKRLNLMLIEREIDEWNLYRMSKEKLLYIAENSKDLTMKFLKLSKEEANIKGMMNLNTEILLRANYDDKEYIAIVMSYSPYHAFLKGKDNISYPSVFDEYIEYIDKSINTNYSNFITIDNFLRWLSNFDNSTPYFILKTLEVFLEKWLIESIDDSINLIFKYPSIRDAIINSLNDTNFFNTTKLDKKLIEIWIQLKDSILNNSKALNTYYEDLLKMETARVSAESKNKTELDKNFIHKIKIELNETLLGLKMKDGTKFSEEDFTYVFWNIENMEVNQEYIRKVYRKLQEKIDDPAVLRGIYEKIAEVLKSFINEKNTVLCQILDPKKVKNKRIKRKEKTWKEGVEDNIENEFEIDYDILKDEFISFMKWTKKEDKEKKIKQFIEQNFHHKQLSHDEIEIIYEIIRGIDDIIYIDNTIEHYELYNEYIRSNSQWWFEDYLYSKWIDPYSSKKVNTKNNDNTTTWINTKETTINYSWTNYSYNNDRKITFDDWREIEISQEEQRLIEINESNLEKVVNFYNTLDELWLKSLWNNRNAIFNWISSVDVDFKPNDSNYLTEAEIKMFLEAVLISTWIKENWIENWNSINLELYKAQYKKLDDITTSWEVREDYDTVLEYSKIESIFMWHFMPQWSNRFDLEKFVEAYKTKWKSLKKEA